MPFWSKSGDKQTFSSLIRGLQYSVNAAMDMLEMRNLELLSKYFTRDGHARVRRLRVDGETFVDIPIISVVNPAALKIKELEMEFSVRISSVEMFERQAQTGFRARDRDEDLKVSMERSNLEISFGGAPDASTVNVRIKFESAPNPEGLSRIIEEYDKRITPLSDRED